MCGFIFTNKPITDLTRVNQYIRHRGPDHTSEVHRGAYTFVHNLLSITGAFTPQPLISSDHRIFCLFNGEIYNFDKFGPYDNDSLCLIPLYQEYGPKFVQHLDGEFAIVLADFNTGILVAATDVFATKPLWITLQSNWVGIASYRSALDRLGFENAKKLQANTILVFTLDTLTIKQQLSVFDFDIHYQQKTNFDDWNRAFSQAVRKRAVHHIREKIFIGLSSGYDSGAIACELLKQKAPFKAYSLIGSENRDVLQQRHTLLHPLAKIEIIQDTAQQRQMAHDFIKKHVEPFKYRIYSMSSDYNEFNLDLRDDHGATSLSMVAACARRDGRKIYLSGQGADEIFADYGFNGHKIYPHSNFGGCFPEDLSIIFPWPSFFESSMLSYLAKEEYVAGAYGLEARYPYLDPQVVQEFLWLHVELKNHWYKSVLHQHMTFNDFPIGLNQKIGF